MDKKLSIVTLNSLNCNVTEFLLKYLESEDLDELGTNVVTGASINSCLKDLNKGKYDLMAVPASEIHGKELEMAKYECRVNGAITPRRPNLLLVSENKIDYQPKSAIILCDYKIIRRQLRRSRKDLRVLSTEAFKSINEISLVHSNQVEEIKWMEDMKKTGYIDGFVTSRKIFDELHLNGRRHALLPDPKDRGGHHFLPIPYSDLIVYISRNSSPKSLTNLISEKEGETIWWIQNQIIGSFDLSELMNTGILVRHRRVRSLMEEAEKNKDLTLEQACHDSEGDVLDSKVHVEVKIERISKNGKRTISIHRIIPYKKYELATISLIRDWGIMLKETSQKVPQDFYSDGFANAFIDLKE